MPDPHERHARSKWEWDSPSSRSQERAAAAQDDPVPRKTPGKKDRNLCKGMHWKDPHVTEVIEGPSWNFSGKRVSCGWVNAYWRATEDNPYRWSCRHISVCKGCGKDFGTPGPARCPEYREITKAEKEFLDAKRTEHQAYLVTRVRRRPVITGPQGYRRKRD